VKKKENTKLRTNLQCKRSLLPNTVVKERGSLREEGRGVITWGASLSSLALLFSSHEYSEKLLVQNRQ
jgi:hypothetical protein